QGLPPLGVCVGVADVGAGAGLAAPVELPRHDARELVIALAPGRRRLAPRVLRLGVLRPRQPGRLGEADVERPSVGGLEQYRAVDHLSPVLVLVETELDERADPAPTLRRAVDDGVMDRVAQRARRARRGRGRMVFPLILRFSLAVAVVALARDEVACGGRVGPRLRGLS